jgi:DNA mismatch endonuclease (patch repair protein)
MPVNNAAFWKKKLSGNRRRDRQVTRRLKVDGWRVLRIWEHELRDGEVVVGKLRSALSASQ